MHITLILMRPILSLVIIGRVRILLIVAPFEAAGSFLGQRNIVRVFRRRIKKGFPVKHIKQFEVNG